MTDSRLTGYDHYVTAGLHSIAHLLPKSTNRCGVYVLTFRNGDRYVGQAVDVTARFAAHRRTYPGDIAEVAFRRVPRVRLDAVEQEEIASLYRDGAVLRNVVHMPGRLGASAFDELVTPGEQEHWLTSSSIMDPSGQDRPDQPQQRSQYSHRYRRLADDARFPPLGELLRRYVASTIPFPARTELSYWALSAIPATNSSTYPRLFTLSVQQMEVLFAYAPKQSPERVRICLNVDAATLRREWGSLRSLAGHAGRCELGIAKYGRPGVAGFTFTTPRQALRVLAMRGVTEAARRLNLDLMRKGATSHWRTHCFDLAETVYNSTADLAETAA